MQPLPLCRVEQAKKIYELIRELIYTHGKKPDKAILFDDILDLMKHAGFDFTTKQEEEFVTKMIGVENEKYPPSSN